MRIAVLGAGLAGVTSAYRLARDGHEVVVVDRGEGAANFTSFANAGLVAPGHAYAWSSPRAPGML
ncbi:MAG: FAD-dependent oxidoreductase, partial [Tistlia sp.]